MSGHGPPPKDPALRQRRNRSTTNATFEAAPAAAPGEVPELPKLSRGRKWDGTVRSWWERIWSSGLSAQWIDVDLDGLLLIAMLRQDLAREPKAGLRKAIAGEIRLQERRFGLDVMSRRSLQLEARAPDGEPEPENEEARRRALRAGDDPRQNLRVVGA